MLKMLTMIRRPVIASTSQSSPWLMTISQMSEQTQSPFKQSLAGCVRHLAAFAISPTQETVHKVVAEASAALGTTLYEFPNAEHPVLIGYYRSLRQQSRIFVNPLSQCTPIYFIAVDSETPNIAPAS